jgi:hypothetical protein
MSAGPPDRKPPPAAKQRAREERLAEALRENLRKRKVQSRERQVPPARADEKA